MPPGVGVQNPITTVMKAACFKTYPTYLCRGLDVSDLLCYGLVEDNFWLVHLILFPLHSYSLTYSILGAKGCGRSIIEEVNKDAQVDLLYMSNR